MGTYQKRSGLRRLGAGSLLVLLVAGPGRIAASGRVQDDRSGPCRLLTLAEVQQVFAGANASSLDRRNEKYGTLSCTWKHATGILQVIEGTEPEAVETVMEEARGWINVFVDPLKPQAEKQVRYDRLSGVGDEAVAIVERMDAAKGFMNDGAILVVRRGKRQVSLLSNDLGKRERTGALKAFEQLGKAVAARLGAS